MKCYGILGNAIALFTWCKVVASCWSRRLKGIGFGTQNFLKCYKFRLG